MPATVQAMQDSAGNAAVSLMLGANPASASYSVQRMESGGYGGGSAGAYPAAAQQPLNHRQVKAGISKLVDAPPMVNYGARRQGRAHDEFWMRFPRFKPGEEAEETLSETSALLFDSMKGAQEKAKEAEPGGATEDANNREVQGMLINDRLVFASNFNSSIDTLVRQGKRDFGQDPTLKQLLMYQQSDAGRTHGLHGYEAENLQEKLASFRRKNQAVFSGQRGAGEQGRGPDATAMALQAKVNAPVIVVNVEDPGLHSMLTSRKYEGRVFLVRFAALDPRTKKIGKNKGEMKQEEAVHAEQKLLLALSHARIKPRHVSEKPLAIMGKYRPCMGCAAALKYYQEQLGFQGLSFDENYGHYFQGSVDSLVEHQQHIMDEHYLEYIRQMVQDDVTSTPALLHEAAPAEAVPRRGGLSLKVPGKYASRQADVTPVASDAEIDEQGTYKRVTRPVEATWSSESAHLGIGKGKEKHTAPRRKNETLTEAEAQQLHALWNGAGGVPATNESRQQAIELAYKHYKRGTMPIKHLAGAVDMSPDRFGSYLTHYEKNGHWTHQPEKSNKHETKGRTKKAAPDKQFSKGVPLDEEGKKAIKASVRSLRGKDRDWASQWEKLHSRKASGEMPTRGLPKELLKTLVELRLRNNYNVPEMSQLLRTGDNGDKLRKLINNKIKKLEEERAGSSASAQPQDVAMNEASAQPAAAAAAPATWATTDLAAPAVASYSTAGYSGGAEGGSASYGGESSSSYYGGESNYASYGGESSNAAAAMPVAPQEIPGFTTYFDEYSQPYYIEDDTGYHYIMAGGRMVRMQMSGDDDVQMSGTGGQY
ncbi:hypothetical protein ACFW1M_42085 [Streptomyces inhibens]|uniref:hypothetical protein n=1 Tax=Streptomyces inhibens TaxID=2293571 RepID=UPI00368FCE93